MSPCVINIRYFIIAPVAVINFLTIVRIIQVLGEPLVIFATLLVSCKTPKDVRSRFSVNSEMSRPKRTSANPDHHPLCSLVYELHHSDLFVSLSNVGLVDA
jgi:hypothetical protein